MKSFDVYQKWLALKVHFTQDSYDYHKYNGKVRAGDEEKFYKSNKSYLYDKLGKKYGEDVFGFFVANFVDSDKHGGLYNENAPEVYRMWQKRMQSMAYNFSEEMAAVLLDTAGQEESPQHKFDNLFKGDSPPILVKLYRKMISIETFIILNEVLGFFPQFNEKLEEDYRWPSTFRICSKYSSFLHIDREKYRKKLLLAFSD